MATHPEVRKFLSEAGKKGGSSKSDKKKEASRKNGTFGGKVKSATAKKKST